MSSSRKHTVSGGPDSIAGGMAGDLDDRLAEINMMQAIGSSSEENSVGLPAFRYHTPAMCVKQSLADRHRGKPEREQRMVRRRQELLQLL
eukprot:CAMPEP_0113951014 /NCGR_PEP_ID=MMETSP1339-20121228/83775_1 /TAXON_ID=94617 /ORGANISM="Fibrocapsa japonica" /LENGTH=89 /DNA_ID=CAMNT_0000959089 /DNA_START=92 /DNA_END=361 /DNA_ORIENTATION=- /assembly_acc=CAM_ASM_000762